MYLIYTFFGNTPSSYLQGYPLAYAREYLDGSRKAIASLTDNNILVLMYRDTLVDYEIRVDHDLDANKDYAWIQSSALPNEASQELRHFPF